PTGELREEAADVKAALTAEQALDSGSLNRLSGLLDRLACDDLYDSQESYVLLFDRTRSLSLHLFEHVHGESRDRGQALVDLQSVYATGGYEVAAKELPDYLPLFLEFLSTRPSDEAREHLVQISHILAALRMRLTARGSDYAAAIGAIESLAGHTASPQAVTDAMIAPDDDPNDLQALDRAWEETAVTFGPGATATNGAPMRPPAGQGDHS
ncbi:MAG: nitrate reductase molybdenum cofactor assembly chaperone, partial [Alphaproteobacteria bacterium]